MRARVGVHAPVLRPQAPTRARIVHGAERALCRSGVMVA